MNDLMNSACAGGRARYQIATPACSSGIRGLWMAYSGGPARSSPPEDFMKRQTNTSYSLGDLIVALFDEANSVVSEPVERKVMVYAALKHLLRTQAGSTHRITLQASPFRSNPVRGE